MQTYNKLVRDKIPEHIQAKGQPVEYHVADDAEYEAKLCEKLKEEALEFVQSKEKEEMADIFEVITALLSLYGWELEDIVALQKEKREARGGFEKRLILEAS
jgi:predicted house-cleaning noncanonical NTP pyrophosphatase (MazG superfamily)